MFPMRSSSCRLRIRLLARDDDVLVAQLLEVLGDVALRGPRLVDDLADGQLAVAEGAEDLPPQRVGHRLQGVGGQRGVLAGCLGLDGVDHVLLLTPCNRLGADSAATSGGLSSTLT